LTQNAALDDAWNKAEDALNTEFFKVLKPAIAGSGGGAPLKAWPTLAQLNACASHAPDFVPMFVAADAATQHYESFIKKTSTVPTRDNWHDLFNAFVWLTFPRAKAALNNAHILHINTGGAEALKLRSAARDALTLFDESGIIVLSDKRALLENIPAFNWHNLFWRERTAIAEHMLFVPFGHALMEKMLNPYIGMVAKVILVEVESVFFTMTHTAQYAWCDAELSRLVAKSRIFDTPKNLLPLPFLGVPDWDARNEDEAFYADTNYFRAGSRTWSFSRNSS
jgi:Protein of unknown function (DUF3025)